MKIIKIILTGALAAALTLTATSCQLSQFFPTATTTAATTAAGGNIAVTTNPQNIAPAEPMDMMATDLSQYVTLPNYKGLAVTDKAEPLTDEEFEASLEEFINAVTLYDEITDRAAAQGDTVTMDYMGKLDGVPFEGGTAQGQTIELSENSGFIDGFADGLIGVMPGSTVDLTLTFPTEYHSAEMAGKTVVFTVTVHSIRGERITPELTDAYIEKATEGDYKTVDSFRVYLRDVLNQQAIDTAHSEALDTLWQSVFQNSKFTSLPEQQVLYYTAQAREQAQSYAQAYGMTYEDFMAATGQTEEAMRAQAEQYVKQDLVFFSLVKAEGLSVSDEEYAEALAELVAQNPGATGAALEAYYGVDYLREAFLWNEMMEMLYFNAAVEK